MKLKEYVKHINKLAEKYPDVECCYSIDDEGDRYNPVIYEPIAGFWEKEDQEFTHTQHDPDVKINAVCIN